MSRGAVSRILRYAGCAVLLGVLALSSWAVNSPKSSPIVPVMIETVPESALAVSSMEKTQERLMRQRQEAIVLLQSVIDDPQADEASRKQALDEKTRIAARMETEASLGALLAHMGFEQTAVIVGEETLSIITPWQTAEHEHNRVQMIDAAVSQSGLAPGAVKIILSKK